MAHEYATPPINMRPTAPVQNAYLDAKAEWDDRIGSVAVVAKNWRVACVASLVISFTLGSGLIYQASRNQVVPLVIAVDQTTGEPRLIGKPTQLEYKPQIQEVKYFLSQIISKLRTVSLDPVLIKRSWTDVYAFLRPAAAAVLNESINSEADHPLKRIGKETVSVELISINQVGVSNSYQARWKETVFTKNGALDDRYTMSGVFTIEFQTPKTEEQLMVNPLGIFISSYQWNKELTSTRE